MEKTKNRILIIVFKGIGDVILTTPLVKALKNANPDNEIYFLTKKFAATILLKNPNIKEILIRENNPALEILRERFDIAIDYMLSTSSLYYVFLSRAKKRISFYRPWHKLFYNQMVQTDYDGYTVNKRFELLKPLNLYNANLEIKPEIYLSEEERKEIENILNINGIKKTDKIATFDITSPRAYRQFSGDKFAAIADFVSELGYKVIFHPGPGEEEYVYENAKKCKAVHLILQKLNLRQLAALISNSSIHIGTSSAPMHIAVSFNVPTFTIYSPYTNPLCWSPPSKNHSWIQGELNKLEVKEITDKLYAFIKGANL